MLAGSGCALQTQPTPGLGPALPGAPPTLAGPNAMAGSNAALPAAPAGYGPVASELNKVAMPLYRIEPPDTLEIDALKIVPKNPYRIEPLDYVSIDVPAGPAP